MNKTSIQQKRAIYIPRETPYQQNIQLITHEGIEAEVYLYDNSQGKPAAACFGGKRAKPDSQYYYMSIESRDKAVENHFSNIESQQNYRKTRSTENTKAERGMKVGDFLYCSWGYDQTNIDFYKVIALKGKKSVLILPVGSKLISSEPPCDKVVPSDTPREYDVLLGQNRGEVEPIPKLAKNGSVCLSNGYTASVWGGKPVYETSSGWGH